MHGTETLSRSADRVFADTAGLRPLRRTHGGCGRLPPRPEGQGEDQPRRVAGEAGRPLGPLAALGRGRKVRAAAATPPLPQPPGPIPVPTFARRRPGTLGGENEGSRRHLPAAPRPQPKPAGTAKALGLTPLPPPTSAGAARPRGTCRPRESQLPPPGPPTTTGPRSAQLGARPAATAHPPRGPGATAVARLLGSRAPLRPLQGPPPAASPPSATARRPPPRAGWWGCVTCRGRGG